VSDTNSLERAIAGALRDTINTHGPITPPWIGSAVKRIVGNLRNVGGGEQATDDAERINERCPICGAG
jgi:hypothetical protein